MVRLGYKKSRHGCQRCKERRVKCDEQQPCSSCIRHKVVCSLVSETPSSSKSTKRQRHHRRTPVGGLTQISPGLLPSASSTDASDPFACFTMLENASRASLTQSWMQDLELMHHYTSCTYATIPGNDDVWRDSVPQEATGYPFLMHCILAFAAHHCAYLTPSKRVLYDMIAMQHQTVAVTEVRSILPNINEVNCHAIFAASSLLILSGFAARGSSDSPPSLEALLGIFHLIRGMNVILTSKSPLIATGSFAALLSQPNIPSDSPELVALLNEIPPRSEPDETTDPASPRTAELKLRDALEFSLASTPHAAFRVIMTWPILLDPTFIECLRQGVSNETFNVMTRYVKVLRYAASSRWFVDGWQNIPLPSD